MALRAVIDHPKFARLKAKLGLNRACTLGYLEATWHFCGRFTQQGDIGRYEDSDIESWVEWDGEPGAMIAAMVATGWLDTHPTHRLIVHDWHEHADRTVKQWLGRSKLDFVTRSGRHEAQVDPHEAPIVHHEDFTLPESAHMKTESVHMCAQLGKVCVPPEPVPEPEPGPVPEPGAGPASEEPPRSRGDTRVGFNEAVAAVNRWSIRDRRVPMSPVRNEVQKFTKFLCSLEHDDPVIHGGTLVRPILLVPLAVEAIMGKGTTLWTSPEYASGCIRNELNGWRVAGVTRKESNGAHNGSSRKAQFDAAQKERLGGMYAADDRPLPT